MRRQNDGASARLQFLRVARLEGVSGARGGHTAHRRWCPVCRSVARGCGQVSGEPAQNDDSDRKHFLRPGGKLRQELPRHL